MVDKEYLYCLHKNYQPEKHEIMGEYCNNRIYVNVTCQGGSEEEPNQIKFTKGNGSENSESDIYIEIQYHNLTKISADGSITKYKIKSTE